MLTLQIPTLLALLGTALMAVVIFAPAANAASVTVSFAPPLAPVERWSPAPADPFATNSAADIFSHRSPEWPALVDPRAAHCDAASRLALADALATVRGPWADAILHRALDDEPDALVRDAIVAALGSAVAR
jgi:hypothetical protein